MKRFALLLVLAASVFAQAPACLSGPVTKGSVTVSCTAIENSTSLAAADAGVFVGLYPPYLFAVRMASTDPDVIGFQVTITYTWGIQETQTQSGVVTAPALGVSAMTPLTYLFAPRGTRVTGVSVQEIKATSKDSF